MLRAGIIGPQRRSLGAHHGIDSCRRVPAARGWAATAVNLSFPGSAWERTALAAPAYQRVARALVARWVQLQIGVRVLEVRPGRHKAGGYRFVPNREWHCLGRHKAGGYRLEARQNLAGRRLRGRVS